MAPTELSQFPLPVLSLEAIKHGTCAQRRSSQLAALRLA
jgi:hypothetical protein